MTRTDTAYETLVFDLDRTLVVHDQSTADVFEAACARCGVEPFCDTDALELTSRLVANGSTELDAAAFDRRLFATAATAAGATIDPTELASAYDDVLDESAVSLRPGARTALALAEEYETALVTNGPERTHATKLAAAGIRDRFDVIVFGSDVSRVKPAPDPIERALGRLGSDPARALKIGDSLEKDVAGANAAGVDSVWIPFADRSRTTADPEPSYTLSTLAELPALLE
ncbi:HAD family hydrolase [Halosolutus amylolyticus]|uniref:HAD family hydrolase n=1 Tax=Halosolutus amylolyticus TaxID=2932267 RepID=A0ABD5PUJ7_9EURY|nr:HAD family hydrolase [Halosolutus amylolyticus]